MAIHKSLAMNGRCRWMTDSYHTVGAQQDRARTWALMDRIAKALERIADKLDPPGMELSEKEKGARGPDGVRNV